MTNLIRSFVAVTALAIGLSACGNGNNQSTSPVVPPVVPPPTPTVEAQFGSCFATKYDAKPFSTPTDALPCPDFAPLSLTTKPAVL